MPASNDFSYAQQQQRSHRNHHYNHFPPREYTDLSSNDIRLLAPCLAPMPPAEKTSASAAYEMVIKQRILELPGHLKNKIPLLSELCKMHRGLNALVVCDLLGFLRKEASSCDLPAARHVDEVCQDGEVKCAGCKLAMIGRQAEGLVALGAGVIGKLGEKNWRKSKRVLFLETWIGTCCEWVDQTEETVERMWELGVQQKREGRRERVERHVQAALAPPARPARSPEQDDHVAFVAANEFPAMGNPFADEQEERRRLASGSRRNATYSRASLVPAALRASNGERSSSVYSTDAFWESARSLTESGWIDMYLGVGGQQEGERNMF